MNNETEYKALLQKMEDTYFSLTGAKVEDASDIGIRFKVLAKEVEELLNQLEELNRQAFPQTATGEALELHALQRGLQRKGAVAAKGAAVFLRNTPADRDIEIPQGTVVATAGNPGTRFATVETVVMKAGQQEVQSMVACTVAGAKGNAAAGAVCSMVTPVPGIQTVTNRGPITGGTAKEDDEALRARLLGTYLNITNGTNSAFYKGIVSAYDEVSSVNVIPRARGTGTVDIIVYGEAADQNFLEELKARLQEMKEINVDILVEKAQPRPVDLSLKIAVTENVSLEDMKAACKERIAGFFEGIAVGQPLVLTHLGRELMEESGLYNYHILSPAGDVTPTQRQKITLGKMEISLLDQGGEVYEQ